MMATTRRANFPYVFIAVSLKFQYTARGVSADCDFDEPMLHSRFMRRERELVGVHDLTPGQRGLRSGVYRLQKVDKHGLLDGQVGHNLCSSLVGHERHAGFLLKFNNAPGA